MAAASKETLARTLAPSEWEKIKILMRRRLNRDKKSPKLWLARTFLGPLLLLLYTIGFSTSYDPEPNNKVEGDFRFFDADKWATPSKVRLAGTSDQTVNSVAKVLKLGRFYDEENVNVFAETNRSSFQDMCEMQVETFPRNDVCIFIESDDTYYLMYGSPFRAAERTLPFDEHLAGAQWTVSNALLNISGAEQVFPVTNIQQLPESLAIEQLEASPGFTLGIGILFALSMTISIGFMIGPITSEKLQEVVRSYILVGVNHRTYMLHWLCYYSWNGIATAGVLTAISIGYNLFPESSGGLIFASHLLFMIQTSAVYTVLGQLITQEELAQGIPWMIMMFSAGISAAVIVIEDPSFWILSVLTAVSPVIGLIQYVAIYVNYSTRGIGTGVHPGDNVMESGIFGNMMGQLVGILIWLFFIVYGTSLVKMLFGRTRRSGVSGDGESIDEENGQGNNAGLGHFEALTPGSEVLMSIRGLNHTFIPNCGLFCRRGGKKNEPVEVLKGLDMDVCRGEVLGYLGHNGAGKTTSVRILSGELPLTDGDVTFDFRDGKRSLNKESDLNIIRSKIGVCPQHSDHLQGDMTCREILRLFAYLKGRITVKSGQTKDEAIEAEVERRLEEIQFTSVQDADKPIETYSGGMKRKVCIALALLGDPEVVFLDEPTAGMDPYNRRTIWDMIIAAKEGRSIILTTHFMDEADVLSDRVGIIKKGKLITCGSTLFLKHHFGVGYTIMFHAPQPINIGSIVRGAEDLGLNTSGFFSWHLQHGTESSFPAALEAISNVGGTNVSLELTTLEQVFLETGKEDDAEGEDNNEDDVANINEEEFDDEYINLDDPTNKASYLSKIWDPRGSVQPATAAKKFRMVVTFMMTNAWKTNGVIFLNIIMPMIYLVGGLVAGSLIDVQAEGDRIIPEPFSISNLIGDEAPTEFFGIPPFENNTLFPIIPVPEPQGIEQVYANGPLVIGGYSTGNETLQYNPNFSDFALQIGTYTLTNVAAQISSMAGNSGISQITTFLQELPYISSTPFRVDLLVIPMVIGFGFVGMTFSVLDVLILKGDNIFNLFRVAGISEWSVYLGVLVYKMITTFVPFFTLVVILELALGSVVLGNGGRWLATLIILSSYAYSTTPIGLILAKRFIHSNFKEVSNWFPGVYMTSLSAPFLTWNILLQTLPESRDTILVVGDILCLIPPVAFQRALAAVIEVSTERDDPDVTWSTVWKFGTRVWLAILFMLAIGTFEWIYLYRSTLRRPAKTELAENEKETAISPIDVSYDPDVMEERQLSLIDDTGINARDLVKVFRVKPSGNAKSNKTPIIKRAVKGVSFGLKSNEIYAVVGPNGAGKSTTMGILSGEHTPEHGEIALDGERATGEDRDTDHLFSRSNVAYCPQFDALFMKKTVMEHLRFYAEIRGLIWDDETTQEHIKSIVKLLGLRKHRNKDAGALSGGYKRRLCLAISMIGYPKCVIVDECTTGMDPGARHLVWNVLRPGIVQDEYDLPPILLSTHYMDEAAKLGTRIGIMIDGELVATGSLDCLQQRYCTSYFVEVSLSPDVVDPDEGKEAVIRKFASEDMHVEVHEALPYHFKLQVPLMEGAISDETKQLAKIFDLLESNRDHLSIKFYSVSQMNLEQIFIDLSRKQFVTEESVPITNVTNSGGVGVIASGDSHRKANQQ